ncbi:MULTISPECIES: flagellar biosynthesis protein FlhB [unclassified Novosphingobium]|uniref:EscU/YscU/HrcU family type III secretion system export apparatus switch protein n=1 Tax=unclassified Novosphingobium TaxID=2644732 RepID=UPI001441850E|nr:MULTISPECIES: flagellar type III secretion system protein FlhB [unclassified Novosphingobium]MBB3359430.1 flagellar biosynthetic protein FlhB [Novosphingobium sp. BK256]MBB3375790.1 flagellar biosynthetic protein FlhB [Novosphingobium sp. BK280]MBB3380203.1 flagellar biosynthetic protein FlhB [Novosphingobium sp. BK258]MBB3421897.1 flagellar biosynthetic protein FlhB [Novosphingobium sp. BK267]MBB3450553.1 flagellar biosynthetic protein FlhB [Novosphingobium sp. BK352]
MAESEGSGEKTFAPTEKRKRDAAQNGDVLRSRELGTAAGIFTGIAWLWLAGPWLLGQLGQITRSGFSWDRDSLDHFDPGQRLARALLDVLPPVLVLGVGLIAVALVSQLAFSSGRWNAGNLAPKGSRLDPAKGLARMFGIQGLIELGKGLAKVTLLGTMAYVWMRGRVMALVGLGGGQITPGALAGQLGYAWDAMLSLLVLLASGLVVIALIDFPVQFVRRFMRLRMSLQDIRDETKESEGSPEKKAAIRGRQRQIAMAGVNKAMREAQFVITNPTHFAVALAYDPALAPAPIVLAKGRGEKALAMRELAAELALPTLEYPALARSVYYTTRERQVIREELYGPIAAILAFVMSLKRGDTPPAPMVNVPVALRFDADGRPEALV